jgi:hypothetical protein
MKTRVGSGRIFVRHRDEGTFECRETEDGASSVRFVFAQHATVAIENARLMKELVGSYLS